jgi:hypothetical protein
MGKTKKHKNRVKTALTKAALKKSQSPGNPLPIKLKYMQIKKDSIKKNTTINKQQNNLFFKKNTFRST